MLYPASSASPGSEDTTASGSVERKGGRAAAGAAGRASRETHWLAPRSRARRACCGRWRRYLRRGRVGGQPWRRSDQSWRCVCGPVQAQRLGVRIHCTAASSACVWAARTSADVPGPEGDGIPAGRRRTARRSGVLFEIKLSAGAPTQQALAGGRRAPFLHDESRPRLVIRLLHLHALLLWLLLGHDGSAGGRPSPLEVWRADSRELQYRWWNSNTGGGTHEQGVVKAAPTSC